MCVEFDFILILNLKFDLVIHDFPAGICLLAFLQKFNYPPMIFVTAYGDYNFIAYATKTAVTPALNTYIMVRQPQNSFLRRLENFLLNLYDYISYIYLIFPACDKMLSTSFSNLPPLMELAQRNVITLFNYEPVVDGKKKFIFRF